MEKKHKRNMLIRYPLILGLFVIFPLIWDKTHILYFEKKWLLYFVNSDLILEKLFTNHMLGVYSSLVLTMIPKKVRSKITNEISKSGPLLHSDEHLACSL
jgi:hypothetical protein